MNETNLRVILLSQCLTPVPTGCLPGQSEEISARSLERCAG
jgi:hypothetical protein